MIDHGLVEVGGDNLDAYRQLLDQDLGDDPAARSGFQQRSRLQIGEPFAEFTGIGRKQQRAEIAVVQRRDRPGEDDVAAGRTGHFFSTFHSASSGTESSPVMLLRIAVGVVNWPSGAKVG